MATSGIRSYKANLERSRAGMSIEQIHKAKCSKKRAAREARKEVNAKKEKERRHLSSEKQLEQLDFRLGVGEGAVSERKKLVEKMAKKKEGR